MKRSKARQFTQRLLSPSKRGFSLVTVASLGAVTMMWLMAISASVLPMYTRSAQSRYVTVVRSAAEAALDYTVNNLKNSIDPATGAVQSVLDNGQPFNVPNSILTPDTNVQGQIRASVTVTNVGPPNSSSIYQKQYDKDPVSGAFPNASSGIQSNGWRVVTATATYAGLQKRIRVILEPNYGNPTYVTSTGTTMMPFFNYGVFGQQSIAMGGNSYIDAYNSSNGTYSATKSLLDGDIASNSYPSPPGATITLGPNTRVNGDVLSFSGGSTTTHSQLDATGTGTINDQLKVNGRADIAADHVLGTDSAHTPAAEKYSAYPAFANSQNRMSVPVAQTAPTTSQVIAPSYSKSGGDTYVGQPATNQVVNLGSVSVTGNSILHLRPGDYQVSSLAVAGNGKIVLDPGVTGGPTQVRLFVQGNASGSNAIQITGNGIVNNGTPSNLQLWYGGSKGTLIGGNGNFTGVVYAPNSSVSVVGNGNVFGAVMGYSVTTNGNVGIHFDTALRNGTQSNNLMTPVVTSTSVPVAPLNGLRTISWQEL
jgi:hypothetical protein